MREGIVCDELNEKMQAAISSVLEDKGMVTRFALVAEVIEAEGDRPIWMANAPDAQAQDTVGLLQYGLMLQQASLTRDVIQE